MELFGFLRWYYDIWIRVSTSGSSFTIFFFLSLHQLLFWNCLNTTDSLRLCSNMISLFISFKILPSSIILKLFFFFMPVMSVIKSSCFRIFFLCFPLLITEFPDTWSPCYSLRELPKHMNSDEFFKIQQIFQQLTIVAEIVTISKYN